MSEETNLRFAKWFRSQVMSEAVEDPPGFEESEMRQLEQCLVSIGEDDRRSVPSIKGNVCLRSDFMVAILRAKLRVSEVLNRLKADGSLESQQVKLSAVTSSDPESENARFSKYTPSATFEIYITNPQAFNKLASGHEFYVDFIPAKQNG